MPPRSDPTARPVPAEEVDAAIGLIRGERWAALSTVEPGGAPLRPRQPMLSLEIGRPSICNSARYSRHTRNLFHDTRAALTIAMSDDGRPDPQIACSPDVDGQGEVIGALQPTLPKRPRSLFASTAGVRAAIRVHRFRVVRADTGGCSLRSRLRSSVSLRLPESCRPDLPLTLMDGSGYSQPGDVTPATSLQLSPLSLESVVSQRP